MKRNDKHSNGDIKPEYDFASMAGGVRGKILRDNIVRGRT
jgi:hypothetical protein